MANISIFGTLQNVTNGALAEGTQIVGGRMSVATIAERDAIPADVLKDGTEVYVTATKLTYRWNAAANAFEKVTYSQLPEPTASDNGKIVSVESGTYGLVSPNLYGGSGRRLIWSSEEGAQVTGEIGFNPIGKTFDVEFAIGSDKPTRCTSRFTCTSSDNSTSPLESVSASLFYSFSNYSISGATTTRYAGYYTAISYFYRLTNESELQYKFRINRTQEWRTDTVYTTDVGGTTTQTSTNTTVNSLNNSFVKLYNLYLIEGTTAIENHTIVASAWTALSGSAPYTYAATVTVTAEISEASIIELYNNNAVLFANYGFAIGAVNGQTVTVYSIGRPAESVTLTVQIGG